jgi:alpha-tubulin suppressor-like RCC1 family protein
MKISEMIETLEQAKRIYGDIYIWGRDESGRLSYVESLEIIKASGKAITASYYGKARVKISGKPYFEQDQKEIWRRGGG